MTESTPIGLNIETSVAPPEISAVLPVRNERECLGRLDRELRQALRSTGHTAEILYVDDHSTDGSKELLRDLVRKAATGGIRTRIVNLRRNYGQTAALAAGFDLAEGRVIVALDSDGQNDPADIPRLLEKLENGFDVVSGWRRSGRNRLISRVVPSVAANWMIARITGVSLHDTGCTLKAYRASLLKEVRLYGEMHRFLPVFLTQLGARVTELEVGHRRRFGGVSKYGIGRSFTVLTDLVLLRFMAKHYAQPMHFFGKLALVFCLATLLAAGWMLVLKLGWLRLFGIGYQASFIETPLPALTATFFLGTVTSLFFGILGEILIRVHHESSGLQPYAIHSIEDSREEPG